jgi:NTP pyrophosphatase (non-canonical NTP hydrolase)
MIRELYQVYKILKWHKKTFPDHTYYDQRKHHVSEMHEWMEAMRNFTKRKTATNKNHLKEEQADVIISGIALLRFNESFQSVIDKMEINYGRTWEDDHHKEN